MIRSATLQRTSSTDEGTFGIFTSDSGFQCYTGELPWRNNENGISCIPAGVYDVVMAYSPKHGEQLYHVQNVPNREAIEIHPANWMGDKSKGFKCDLLGCIALGADQGELDGQQAVLHSGPAVMALERDMNLNPFSLTILDIQE
jgi:hypothetical protein